MALRSNVGRRLRETAAGSSLRDTSVHQDARVRDRALVRRIRADDQAAFAEVFHAYRCKLCVFAYRYVGSLDIAADLVQEVFLRVWLQRYRWELRGTLQSYLYRAVRNRALDVLKHRAIERRRGEEAEWERRHNSVNQSVETPDRVLELKTLALEVERALDDIPERRRQVFLLRWKYGLSYAEVGSQLGITPKTVENQLNRVLHVLRERLAAEHG